MPNLFKHLKEVKPPSKKVLIELMILALATAAIPAAVQIYSSWLEVSKAQTELLRLNPKVNQDQFNVKKGQYDAVLERYKANVSTLGTIATVIGGAVLYLNFTNATAQLEVANKNTKLATAQLEVANKNTKLATAQLEVANKNTKLAESRLITERFSKAVEQLASDKIEIRLGGIYALERIAKDSKEDHWTIMEVLTSFIRERSPFKKVQENKQTLGERFLNGQKQETSCSDQQYSPPTDVQAALTVIGRRKAMNDGDRKLNLSQTNLKGANLREAKLRKADLSDAALSGADLREANLILSNLTKTDLSEANFKMAKLVAAVLTKANLSKANLSDVELGEGARFSDADLSEADLSRTNLSTAFLDGANLSRAELNMAILNGAILRSANLSGAKLLGVNLSDADLNGADLSNADLSGVNFKEADLSGAKNFSREYYRQARLCRKLSNTKIPEKLV